MERRQPLTDEEVDRIANAVADKARVAFHIEDEKHYNDHQRLEANAVADKEAVADKARVAFHIEDEKHYNDHQRLDRLLTAYENATNLFWKTFLGLVIIGMIVLTGTVTIKGWK